MKKRRRLHKCLCDVSEGGSPRICKVHSARGDAKAPRPDDWNDAREVGQTDVDKKAIP